MAHDHVRIAVKGAKTKGTEQVPAQRVEAGNWKLIRSPLYAMGAAAGDVLKLVDDETGAFEIIARGGNVAVHFYLREEDMNDVAATDLVASTIAREIASLGGSIDGQTAGLIVFTLPVRVGFPAIERIFESAAQRFGGAEWQFANVYDPVNGDPLRWWE
jgi:hypothetical protein